MVDKSIDQECQFALIHVGEEKYAVDIMRVKEILRPQKITTVKRSPNFVHGMIDLRGEIIPVVDLRKRLGGAAETDSIHSAPSGGRRKERIVVVDVAGRKTGLIVDEASEVFRLMESAVQPPPPTATGEDPLFAGIAPYSGDLIMVLNLDHIFTVKERRELKDADMEEEG